MSLRESQVLLLWKSGREGLREVEEEKEKEEKNAVQQLIHASGRAPKRARASLALMAYSGPTARQDAENA